MVHKFNPARMGSLTSERRKQAVQPLELLQRAGVQSGETILDWGCGAGFFALPAARLVGETGKIVAVDMQPEMVAATMEAAVAAIAVTTSQVVTCLAPRRADIMDRRPDPVPISRTRVSGVTAACRALK